MSDIIIINSTSVDHIITNFISATNNVVVDLKDISYTLEMAGPPELITVNVENPQQTVNVLHASNIDVTINRDGMSAYQIAIRNGFIGTEQEWLNSLGQVEQYVTLSSLNSLNTNIIYAGFSSDISLVNDPIWQIYRLDIITNIILHAPANQIWANRESLTYGP
jgi:hypothetical protein